jgi:hypothetical protein
MNVPGALVTHSMQQPFQTPSQQVSYQPPMQASTSYAPGVVSPLASLRVGEKYVGGPASLTAPIGVPHPRSGSSGNLSFAPTGVASQGSVCSPSNSSGAQSWPSQAHDEGLVARLQLEVEQLRREVLTRDSQMAESAKELREANENRENLMKEVESLRAERHQLSSELALLRMDREQYEGMAPESRVEIEEVRASKGRVTPSPPTGTSTPSRFGARPPRQGMRERSLSNNAPASRVAKDEIDSRLLDFLEQSDCALTFRRMNRGWYAFRRMDDVGPISGDRCVELSLVNNKLMAQVEVQTHERGWNNGRPGAIERFVAHFAA